MESATVEKTLEAAQGNTNEEAVRSTANEASTFSDGRASPAEAQKSEVEVSKDALEVGATGEGANETQQQAGEDVGSASVTPPANHRSSGFPRSDYVPPLPGTGMDATNVFIKYLPTDLTNTGLFTLFSQFGEITSCKVMVDPITGYSLGYGYVSPLFTLPLALRIFLLFHVQPKTHADGLKRWVCCFRHALAFCALILL